MKEEGKASQVNKTMPRYLLSFYREWFTEINGRCDILVTENGVLENDLDDVATNGVIVLNIGGNAVREFSMDDDSISFMTRFKSKARQILLDYSDIIGVRNPETGLLHPITMVPVLTGDKGLMVMVAQKEFGKQNEAKIVNEEQIIPEKKKDNVVNLFNS